MLPKEMEAVFERRFRLGCPRMTLRRADGVEVYSGGGIVEMLANGQLQFVLVAPECGVVPADHLMRALGGDGIRPGSFVPDEHFFTLEAVDTRGRSWTSAPTLDVSPDFSGNHEAFVTGQVSEIRELSDRTAHPLKKPFLRYWLTGKLAYPCNKVQIKDRHVKGDRRNPGWERNTADIRTRLLNVRISRDRDGRLFVEAVNRRPRRAILPHLDLRLAEALQFVTGRPIDWCVLELGQGTEQEARVRAIKEHDVAEQLPQPLLDDPGSFRDFSRMLEAYLVYVSGRVEPDWHPLSRRVYTLQRIMSALWHIQLLVIGVEIEGLLRDEFGMSSSDKAGRFLKELARKRTVHGDCVGAWLHLRGQAAHALRAGTEISNERLVQRNQMLALFYELVFHRIGYAGKYRYLGDVRFSIHEYPLEP